MNKTLNQQIKKNLRTLMLNLLPYAKPNTQVYQEVPKAYAISLTIRSAPSTQPAPGPLSHHLTKINHKMAP